MIDLYIRQALSQRETLTIIFVGRQNMQKRRKKQYSSIHLNPKKLMKLNIVFNKTETSTSTM
jgi:hypothetical protein